MHRFSPFSNRGIRRTTPKRALKRTPKKELRRADVVVDTLLSMGFNFEDSYGILSYLDKDTMDVPNALRVMEKLTN